MTEREYNEVIRRVARRVRRSGALYDRTAAQRIATDELTKFYREQVAGVVTRTVPTLGERAGHVIVYAVSLAGRAARKIFKLRKIIFESKEGHEHE